VFLPERDVRHEGEAQNQALIELILEIIDAIKGQVRVKHWRAELP
jgi:hypothetical protein